MNTQSITPTKPVDIQAAFTFLHRAADMARQTAIDTNTCLAIMENGK